MTRWIKMCWNLMRRDKAVAAIALGLALLIAVNLGFWFGLDWKALIGWKALVHYIDPQTATARKDAVQVYAVIVAGVVAAITATVGLLNLRLTRRNLEQQRELEAQRAAEQRQLESQRAERQRQLAEDQAQGTVLQAYYEQIGKLLTDNNLLDTQRKEIRELARGQTLTVLQQIDKNRKRTVLSFLHAAGLIEAENPAVALTAANLSGAELSDVDLRAANLRRANLSEAVLSGADLQAAELQEANLRRANLQGANLVGAHLAEADFQEADLQGADLTGNKSFLGTNLEGANLQGANLSWVPNLTQEQIDWTIGSTKTRLGEDLNRPELWSKSYTEQKRILRERFGEV